MANTLKFGNGEWYGKKDTILAYNDENSNYKPLPFDFSRASNATVINKDGLIETVGSGQPRIDYKDDSEGALLLEPQRTNLATYSEDFSDSYWTKSGSSSVTPNTTISPDGTLNADTISNATGTSTSDTVYRTINPDDVDHTFSAYVKSSGATTMSLILRNGISGVILSQAISLTSEWQRVTLTHNIQNGQIIFGNSDGDFHLWGAQLEQGSYATSYIPTQGSTVTRLADSCSQTPPDGVIGQTEGTVFLDFKPQTLDATSRFLSIENSSSVSNGWMGIFSALVSGDIRFRFYGDGWDFNSTLIIEKDTRYKIAVSYKNGVQTSAYVNGNLIGNLTASLSGKSFQKIRLSEAAIGVRGDADFNDIKLYNTRLSNSELQALTS